MTTAQVIRNAERITVLQSYPDGSFLYDIGIGDKAYVVRQFPETVCKLLADLEADHD